MKTKKSWFGQRWHGFFGPIPQTWQGWLMTILVLLVITVPIVFMALQALVSWTFVVPFVGVFLIVFVLLVMASLQTKKDNR